MILCMTVNPGWGGQAFLESSIDKLKRIRALVGPDPEIEVDGGITAETARRCAAGGRDRLRGRDGGLRGRGSGGRGAGHLCRGVGLDQRVVRPAVCERVRTVTTIEPVDCTVLIVDDHPSFRASARVLLESEGFNVIGEAVDGASAVSETCRLKPMLVLLDVQLPDIDGFDVAARITGHPDSPAVILVSSRDSSDFGPLVSRSGARGFVPKAELSGERVQELLD